VIHAIDEGFLYTSARPGRHRGRAVLPPRQDVDDWVSEALNVGIGTIICVLEDRSQLHRYYDPLNLHPWGLLGYYVHTGFEVFYFDTQDYHRVPDWVKVEATRIARRARKPVVLQDSGGSWRTGQIARYVAEHTERAGATSTS
jgi:hypothetical protein